MKVIAGLYKGRKLISVKSETFRPTKMKIKEALFSMLSSGQFIYEEGCLLDDAVVLDLFCGSGALGLEALSRRAKHVVFVDNNDTHLAAAKEAARQLGVLPVSNFICCDACFLPKSRVACDLVFIDPPYGSKLVVRAIEGMIRQNWMKPGCVIVVEQDNQEKLDAVPDKCELLFERVYGKSKLMFLEFVGLTKPAESAHTEP